VRIISRRILREFWEKHPDATVPLQTWYHDSEADFRAALKEVENLPDSQPGTPEGDRMDVLVTLIEAYETRHYPIREPDDPVEVLRYYMDSRGLKRSDLIPFLGSKERVSEVLSGKRRLSLAMIRHLHAGLGIPADLLIGPEWKQAKRKSPA
jgi:HTH-type transcriptional regulator/antitoxin HigA